MNPAYQQIRQDLVHFCKKIYDKGYTQTSGGNVSCRVPGTDLVAIKKTAISMGEMTEADVLIVDQNANLVDGEGKPSKEVNFHLAILRARPECNAVVHCHPNYATSIANGMIDLPLVTVTARKALGPKVPVVKTALAGTMELCNYVEEAYLANPDIKAILMEEHGICTAGVTLEAAYNLADLLEATAQQAIFTVFVKNNIDSFRNL